MWRDGLKEGGVMEGMKAHGSILMLFSTNFSLIYPIYPKALWGGGCMLCSLLQRRVRHFLPAKVQCWYNCAALFQGNYTVKLEVRVEEEECKSIFQVDILQKQKKSCSDDKTYKAGSCNDSGGKKVLCCVSKSNNTTLMWRSGAWLDILSNKERKRDIAEVALFSVSNYAEISMILILFNNMN